MKKEQQAAPTSIGIEGDIASHKRTTAEHLDIVYDAVRYILLSRLLRTPKPGLVRLSNELCDLLVHHHKEC